MAVRVEKVIYTRIKMIKRMKWRVIIELLKGCTQSNSGSSIHSRIKGEFYGKKAGKAKQAGE
jgi:hypothetical protein